MFHNKSRKKFLGVSGVLARLWHTILYDRNIPPDFLRVRITDYVNRSNKTGSTSATKREHSSNIANQLGAEKLSWKNMFRGLYIIGAVSATITLKISYKRLDDSVHEVTFNIADANIADDDDDINETDKKENDNGDKTTS